MNLSHITLLQYTGSPLSALSPQQLFSSVQCSHFIIDISPPQQNKLFVYCFLRPSLVSSVTQHFISSCFIATLSGQLSTALSSHQLFSEVTLHTTISVCLSSNIEYCQTYQTGEITEQASEPGPGTCWTQEIKLGLHYY